MISETQKLVDELDHLLDRERAHLLKGDLPKFTELLDEKEKLLTKISDIEGSEMPDLEGMRSRMTYNQSLLESAMRGIRAAAERLQALRNIRKGLETYDSQGQRRTLPNNTGGNFERRA